MEQRKKKSKKRGVGRTILFAVIALILIACAVAALLYRDKLTPDSLSKTFSGDETSESSAEPFTYEGGSMQVFAVSGNRLAVASSTGFQVLNEKGKTAAREVLSLDTPAISASERRCAVYDAGGTEIRIVNEDNAVTPLKTEDKILSARINSDGYLAVVTEETGYKAVVTVYDSELNRVFAWHSGSAYVLAAEVSSNNRMLAALCVDTDGGKLEVFSLSEEEPIGTYTAPGELFRDLRWMSREQICLLAEDRLVFTNTNAEVTGEYDYQGRYLLDYDLGGNFAALLLSDYRSGGNGVLVTVDADAREKGSAALEQRDVYSVSAGSDKLLVLYADRLELMTDLLAPLGSTEEILGVKKALLRKDGKCLLLTAYAAELIDLY